MTNASEARIADDLCDLTESLAKAGWQPSGGLLGGEYGYGADYENETFEMHPFWWGECECGHSDAEWAWEETHPHADDCYQSELERRGGYEFCAQLAKDWGMPAQGSAVHCTCTVETERLAWVNSHDHDPKCGVARPNFLHKSSGIRVDWYKYIGRSMEFEPVEKSAWSKLYDECIASITPGTWVQPEPLTPEEEAEAYKAFEESMYTFEGSLPEVLQQMDETFHPVESIARLEADDF